MARQDILLIGLDYNSLRILEVSLRKAGFMVTSVSGFSDAIEQMRISPPDLVIVDSSKDEESFEFASNLKREFGGIPVIIISANKDISARIKALEIGIDDYLIKPIYIKEIIARVRIHLQRRDYRRVEDGITAGFIGSLSDVGLWDIIQTIEANRKSGILEVKGKIQDGRIYFKNGQIVQASTGKLRGELAVYKMLTFGEGVFRMSFLDIDVEPDINKSNKELLMEGMRRLDEYMKYTEQLPPLTTRLEVNSEVLVDRLREMPDNVNKVIKLIDSERSINDILEMSELDELETLKIISALYFDGIVYDIFSKKEERSKASTLPPPKVEVSPSIESSTINELKRPRTSEIWAEKVFVKEEKNVGDMSIAESIAQEDSKKAEDIQGGVKSEHKEEALDKEAQKRDISEASAPPARLPSHKGPESVISDEPHKMSLKEQLIENTLIENLTTSTSPYVKGSLLGEKKAELVKKKRGTSILLPVFILVTVASLSLIGYWYYTIKGKGGTKVALKVPVVAEKNENQPLMPLPTHKKGSESGGDERENAAKVSRIDEESAKAGEESAGSERVDTKGLENDKEVLAQRQSGVENEKKEQVSTGEKVEKGGGIDQSVKEEIKDKGQGRVAMKGGDEESQPEIDIEGYKGHLKVAEGLYKSGNSNGAREELKRALIKNPKGFEAFTLLGQIDLEANKIKSAITYFKRAITYNGRYAPAYFYLGSCYQLEGNTSAAKKMYEKYLKLAPNGEFANDVRAIISDLK